MRFSPRTLGFFLIIATPAALVAYGTRVHALLPENALSGALVAGELRPVAAETLPGVSDADLAAFRASIWTRGSRAADTTLRRRFLTRYPTAASFTAGAFKELMMASSAARVLGIDSFASVYRAMTRHDRSLDPNPDYAPGRPIALLTALQMGSIYPDLDRRNQARLARGPDGAPLRTAAGDSIPYDPMTLNMGRLTGLSSQAGAHYGLNREPKSSEPSVLKSEPWNFAIATAFPGDVETYGPDNAQAYTDLALLAQGMGPAGRTLSAFYAGNAMHYIADVGNAVHTVQVGIYPIFFDATIQAWLRKALSLFGLLGKTPSRNSIGIDIIANLHSMSERLYESELADALAHQQAGDTAAVRPSMRGSLRALETGDDSLARIIRFSPRAVPPGDFGRAIANELIDANVRDGAEVYRVTREIIASRLRTGRIALDFDTIPDAELWKWLRVHEGAVIHTGLDDFNAVHQRGIARTTSALRAWWNAYRLAGFGETDRVLARFLRERLDYLDAAERRRAEWMRMRNPAG